MSSMVALLEVVVSNDKRESHKNKGHPLPPNTTREKSIQRTFLQVPMLEVGLTLVKQSALHKETMHETEC